MNAKRSPNSLRGRKLMWLAALPICFGLVPLQAEAFPGVAADATLSNKLINSDVIWTVLAEVVLFNPHPHYCIATGSSDAANPGDPGKDRYRFTLSLSPAVPPPEFERTLEFRNEMVGLDLVKDNGRKEITSTGGVFVVPQGEHSIYWLGQKFDGVSPDLSVRDSSLTVVCTDYPLEHQ